MPEDSKAIYQEEQVIKRHFTVDEISDALRDFYRIRDEIEPPVFNCELSNLGITFVLKAPEKKKLTSEEYRRIRDGASQMRVDYHRSHLES